MNVIFDETKRLSNLDKHGLDTADFAEVFDKKGTSMASDEHASGFVPGRGYTQEDWDEVSDNPEITAEQAAASRPLAEAMPELVAAMRRGRGNPRAATKDLVSMRLDKDVLATLRASGSGWQGRANEMLRRGLGLDAGTSPTAAD